MSRGAALAAHGTRLPYHPPLDWSTLLHYLAARTAAGVERVSDGGYERVVRHGHALALIDVRDAGDGGLTLRVRSDPSVLEALCADAAARVRGLFDLDAEPAAIGARLACDPRLGARPGLRVPGAWDGFELAVRAVLGQQVSVRAATTFAARLMQLCGEPLPPADEVAEAARALGLTHTYPTPQRLAAADLSSVGLTRARQETLRRLAAAVAEGTLRLTRGGDIAATVARLCELPGVGAWTAQYIALRALRDPDALPVEDLGLRRALARDGRPLSARELHRQGEAWRPWRGYAAMALWMGAAQPVPHR